MSGGAVTWVAFTPRDTVLVRDGRSFDAGADAIAETVSPWPSTIAGAVGAAYGAEPAEVRGPVLARWSAGGWQPHFPVPADLVRLESAPDRVCRLRPARAGGGVVTDLGDDLEWLMPPEGAGRTGPLAGWLPGGVLTGYLDGRIAPGPHGGQVPDLRVAGLDPALAGHGDGGNADGILVPERRVGLARTAGRTAMTGYLYQMTHLRLPDGWALLAACTLGAGWRQPLTGPVRFGGRGRQADVEPAAGVAWPQRPSRFPGGRLLAYVATPAIWPAGWRIPVPPGAGLVAAAVGKPQAVAMASPGKVAGTRVLRWAVPAGSVYLLRFDSENAAERWADDWHGRAYGRREDDRLRTAGFGVVLTGVWS